MKDLQLLGATEGLDRQLSAEYVAQYEAALEKDYRPYHITESLDSATIAAVCYYAERNGIDIVLGEIPEIIQKCHLAYTMTRLQLENVLKVCAKETVYNPEVQPNTPWNVANVVFPEVVTRLSDQYMAAVVKQLAEGGSRRCLVLQGGVQAQTTMEYLFRKAYPDGVHGALQYPEWKPSLLEGRFIEDILERFSILDVMQHGPDLFRNFDRISFKSTYAIMKKYSPPTQSLREKGELRFLHARLMKHHHDKMMQEVTAARAEVQKLFLSRA